MTQTIPDHQMSSEPLHDNVPGLGVPPPDLPSRAHRMPVGFTVELTDGSYRLIGATGFHVSGGRYHFHNTAMSFETSQIRRVRLADQ